MTPLIARLRNRLGQLRWNSLAIIAGSLLVVLLSDMWSEDVEAAIGIIEASGQKIWGIHVLTREEVEPDAMGDGDVRMVDMESGHEVEIALDRSVHDRYRKAYLDDFPGYYKTGDAGYIDADGYVYVMTRVDDVINVAGHRLSTGAMEEVLASHNDVAECAVICVADDTGPLKVIVLLPSARMFSSVLLLKI